MSASGGKKKKNTSPKTPIRAYKQISVYRELMVGIFRLIFQKITHSIFQINRWEPEQWSEDFTQLLLNNADTNKHLNLSNMIPF